MEALTIIGNVIVALAMSGLFYIICKALISFAKFDKKENNIFKNKHNEKI